MRTLIAGAALVMLALTAATVPAYATQKREKKMGGEDPKIAVVERMIEAWNTQNWPLVGDLFTKDGVLHSMMIPPVVGREAIAERIIALGAGVTAIKLDIRNMGRVGDVIFVERVDRFTYKGHEGAVPVVGVIDVEGDKIKEWREYYDRAQLLSEMGVKQDFHSAH